MLKALVFLSLLSVNLHAASLKLVAVGDVLLHPPLQKLGLKKGFDALWKEVIPIIQQADIAYANLEGPACWVTRSGKEVSPNTVSSRTLFTGFPMFNYPPQVISDLKSSGFDIVSTANNHSLDRFSKGIDNTIDQLKQKQLLFSGTIKRGDEREFATVIEKNGISLAFIACTHHTNGIKDKYNQVLFCHKKKDRQWLLNKIADLRNKVDGVIITPHFGLQYQTRPNKSQRAFAKAVLEAGALMVIGSHPHVMQPITRYQTKDKRDTLIAYSLGNFVSNQGSIANRASGILAIELSKSEQGLNVNSFKLIPTMMQNRGGKMTLRLVTNKKSRPYRHLKRIVKDSLSTE